ncbi:unnamed protein product [Protopolystoma xenopodis]|uniref:Uncharacterized protein n=1 Tax=Protopolystoma xenopodis TaxID=117903 RepID=A0A3S5CNC0_9PLAT|nr:unnamed protein product [Protopolystoma xenopodis]
MSSQKESRSQATGHFPTSCSGSGAPIQVVWSAKGWCRGDKGENRTGGSGSESGGAGTSAIAGNAYKGKGKPGINSRSVGSIQSSRLSHTLETETMAALPSSTLNEQSVKMEMSDLIVPHRNALEASNSLDFQSK